MSEKTMVTRPAMIPTRIIGLRYSMKLMPKIYVNMMLLGFPVSRAAENVFAEANSHIRYGISAESDRISEINYRMIGVRHRITISFDVHSVNTPANTKKRIMPVTSRLRDFSASFSKPCAMSLKSCEFSAELHVYARQKNSAITVSGIRLELDSTSLYSAGAADPNIPRTIVFPEITVAQQRTNVISGGTIS